MSIVPISLTRWHPTAVPYRLNGHEPPVVCAMRSCEYLRWQWAVFFLESDINYFIRVVRKTCSNLHSVRAAGGRGWAPAYENLWLLLPFQALSVYNRM